ncbi:unnamed protein product [Coffea canephora]|uniref:DH200=94 genomic scaffold, scaffold_762 n=1 Tax=Coffea canephora TaxID=49390 RepID=A0A068VH37_COFCA|nr:unnamed protein product [Coffea canephora]
MLIGNFDSFLSKIGLAAIPFWLYLSSDLEMRAVLRSIKQFRSASRGRATYSLHQYADICRCYYPSYLFSRGLHADATRVAIGEINGAGPLVEYERRVTSGELVDGDVCQLGTLRELQRLCEQLVENADACQLD